MTSSTIKAFLWHDATKYTPHERRPCLLLLNAEGQLHNLGFRHTVATALPQDDPTQVLWAGRDAQIPNSHVTDWAYIPERAVPVDRPLAAWLLKEHTNKNTQRGVKYYKQIHLCTPVWADKAEISRVYRECKRRRKNGEDVVVDHIVPLISKHVCGLHWHENLRIIHRLPNAKKSNKHWPGQWMEQQEIDIDHEPHQLVLEV